MTADAEVTYQQPGHTTLTPHSACRYAVVFTETLTRDPNASGYQVVAVHALCDDGHALVSPVLAGSPPRYLPPLWINWPAILTFAPNSERAYDQRRALHEEDAKAAMT